MRGGTRCASPGYAAQVRAAGLIVAPGLTNVAGQQAVLIQATFSAFGGTMGVAAGEKVVRALGPGRGRPAPRSSRSPPPGESGCRKAGCALAQMGRTTTTPAGARRPGS